MKLNIQILLISLCSIFLFAQAICVPRNITCPPLSPTPLSSILEDPFAFPEAAPIADESLEPDDPSEPEPEPKPTQKGGGAVGLGDICKQTENVQLCQETIGPKLGPGEKVTPMTALLKEIQVVAEESKQAVKATNDAKARDPGNAKSYKVCSEMFRDCQDELQTARKALAANDMATARIRVSGAMTYFGTCDDTFEETGHDSPIAQTTARLKKLASNCLAIAAIQ